MTAPALLPAVTAALRRPHDVCAKLYTDGHELRWLPRALPGWYPIHAAVAHRAPERLAA